MKQLVTITFMLLSTSLVFSQSNSLTTGGNNSKVERITSNNKTYITFIAQKEVEIEILQKATGKSSGFKFVPLIPFLPKHTPGIINVNAEEIKAEEDALQHSGGDIIINKKVERTYKGFLFILWFEKIEVSGIAAKIIKQ